MFNICPYFFYCCLVFEKLNFLSCASTNVTGIDTSLLILKSLKYQIKPKTTITNKLTKMFSISKVNRKKNTKKRSIK